ncbi:hypothetical protein HDU76_004034 [Blyttiomyces sp. JEL0837]|nr:hypothetical protein HDU76_004034 [Blyttiomyces sp. JEL0837]
MASISLWDLIPPEVKEHIFNCSDDLLTRYLNHLLTHAEIETHGNEIWRIAIKTEWDEDLSTLPPNHFPTIKTGLELVASRQVYIRLCTFRPDLINTNHLKDQFDPTKVANEDRPMEKLGTLLDCLSDLLIHVPLRQQWYDGIPEWLKNDKLTLFCVAACFGHNALLESLLTDPELRNNHTDSSLATICLKFAVRFGDQHTVSLLLQREHIYVGYDNNAALFCAYANGSAEMVELLLEREIPEIDVDNDEEITQILVTACENGNVAVVRLLLENDTFQYYADYQAALYYAAKGGHEEVIKLLFWEGMEIDVNGEYELVPVFGVAAQNGHLEVMKTLVGAGADPSGYDNYAISMAAQHGQLEAVRFLLSFPGVDATVSNNYPIQMAARNGQTEVVKLLLEIPGVDCTVDDHDLRPNTVNLRP